MLLLDPASFCEASETAAVPCEERELQEADTQQGAGGAIRAAARDAALQKTFRFGILDGRKWKDFGEDHLVTVESLPRLMVLNHKAKTFHVDRPEDGTSEAAIRAFAARVEAGGVRAEYEDWKGMPDRWWRKAVDWVPPLAALDFLPRYTFSSMSAAILAYLLYLLMMLEPLDSDEYSPPKRGAKRD